MDRCSDPLHNRISVQEHELLRKHIELHAEQLDIFREDADDDITSQTFFHVHYNCLDKCPA